MGVLKTARFGHYWNKDRSLQSKLSFEHTSLTWRTALVYKYLGSKEGSSPDIDDVQTTTFMETPDRLYEQQPIEINIDFDQFEDHSFNVGDFGIIGTDIGNTYKFRLHVKSFEDIGRILIQGDVMEIPFLEYDYRPTETSQESQKALFEITNVDTVSANIYENFFVEVTAVPMKDRQQTEDIPVGDSNRGLLDNMTDDLQQEAEDEVSKEGVDASDVETEDEDQTREDYDPRKEPQKSFLDTGEL